VKREGGGQLWPFVPKFAQFVEHQFSTRKKVKEERRPPINTLRRKAPKKRPEKKERLHEEEEERLPLLPIADDLK
jgi:hypothetical protein